LLVGYPKTTLVAYVVHDNKIDIDNTNAVKIMVVITTSLFTMPIHNKLYPEYSVISY